MYQVKIEPAGKTRFRIYLNGEFAFALYKNEALRCGLRDGGETDEETVRRIRDEVVLKRAKQKALKLLQDMDRTKNELKERLIRAEFPEDIAIQATEYAESFGYLNDERYVESFILGKKAGKSRKEIYSALCGKQVDREIVDAMMESCYEEEDSQNAIRRILRKKRYCAGTAAPEEKRKIYAYLARKGFGYREIQRAMEINDLEEEW